MVRNRWVTFAHPFRLQGMRAPHQAGTFELRVERPPLDVSWEAYRKTFTLLLISNGEVRAWQLTAAELDEAIAADRAHGVHSGLS